MFCTKCGTQIPDGAKFCANCGNNLGGGTSAPNPSPVPTPPPNGQPYYGQPPVSPAPGGKVNKKLMIIIAATVAVILLIGVAAASILSGSTGTVGKAVMNTFSDYSEALGVLSKTDFAGLAESRRTSQTIDVELRTIPSDSWDDYTMLQGAGVTLGIDNDLPGRKMSISAAARYGSMDIASVQLAVDDSIISAGSPELTDGTFYGINTEELSQTLQALNQYGTMPNISFNVYDLVEMLPSGIEIDKNAGKDLLAAIAFEDCGSVSKSINGTETNCKEYIITIPQNAMRDYIMAVEEAVLAASSSAELSQALQNSGLNSLDISEIVTDSSQGIRSAFSSIYQFLPYLGDLKITTYIANSRIAAFDTYVVVDDIRFGLSGQLGGGKNYADNLSLTFNATEVGDYDGFSIALVSQGNHSAKGEFTDNTTVTINDYGDIYQATSDLRYDAKKKADNFACTVRINDEYDTYSVSARGQVESSSNKFHANMEELSIFAEGETLSISCDYTLESYAGSRVKAKNTLMLKDMTMSDITALGSTIQRNVENLGYKLMGSIPGIIDLF